MFTQSITGPYWFALRALVLLCVFRSSPQLTAGPPNVIVIYSDDQGSLDLNCYGSTDLATPHLDGLAKRGTRFTQFYAPSAICSSSRAGLMTGRFPARAGVPSNVSSQAGVSGMPTEEVTMGELFQSHGYRTAHVGKWHLGYTPETMPNGQGFDSSFGHMGGCIDNYSHFFYWNGPNRHDLWRNGKEIFEDGRFFPDLMVDEMKRVIGEKSDKPFFIYWAINVPHYPLQGTAKWRDHYAALASPRNMYAAFVSTMDETIGEVLTELDRLGLQDDTLIVFQSDHGHSTEERTHFSGGNPGPYRGAKGCLFEGGLRVPAIVSWPGVIPENTVRDQMCTGCDWFPTLADYCELKLPDHHLDGKSFKATVQENAPSPHESFYWQLGAGKNPQWVVRRGNWKLLGNPQDTVSRKPVEHANGLFLVNLKDDLSEATNLAAERPEILKELLQLRDGYVDSLQAGSAR